MAQYCLRNLPSKFSSANPASILLSRSAIGVDNGTGSCQQGPQPSFVTPGTKLPQLRTRTISPLNSLAIQQRLLLPIVSRSDLILYSMPDNVVKLKPSPALEEEGGKSSPLNDRPSVEDLHKVFVNLQNNLPKLFLQPMDYSLYRQDIEFIDNIRNKVFMGLPQYIQQVSLLRVTGHLKFATVKFTIISMSQSVQEGRVTVRWRISGVSGLRVFLKLWQFKLWKWKDMLKNQEEEWYDGISYFDVDVKGSIFRHIADKVEVDQEQLQDKKKVKNPIVAKLALLGLLFPQNALEFSLAFKALTALRSAPKSNNYHSSMNNSNGSSSNTNIV